jgi:hypothetical protein
VRCRRSRRSSRAGCGWGVNRLDESVACIDFSGAIGKDLRLAAERFRFAPYTSGPDLISRFILSCAVIASALLAAPAGAQSLRQLPEGLVLTTMKANGGDVILLGDKPVRLSPAAQVRGTNNLIVLSSYLNGTYRVGVKQDIQGMVHRIWILTDAEYKALKQKK